MEEEVKILRTPLRISIAVLILGFLFKIMHWPYGNLIITVSFILISILYFFRFFNKSKKILLDYAKLLLVFSFSIRGIIITLHLPFKDVFNIIALIAALAWLLLGGHKDYYGNSSVSNNKYFRGSVIGIGSIVIIVGALFKMMHWPGASIMLIVGLSLVALFYLITALK